MNIDIKCTHCDTPAIIKNNMIKMACMCDDDRRILNLNDYIKQNKYEDYLYSMFNDDFVYNEEKS